MPGADFVRGLHATTAPPIRLAWLWPGLDWHAPSAIVVCWLEHGAVSCLDSEGENGRQARDVHGA